MSRFRRAALGESFGYTPGEQPPEGGGWLKLNTNEAPLPPSPAVEPALAAAAAELRRYPDPFADPLRAALAAHHGVQAAQVMVGNGADDVLDCCFRAFCGAGDRAVYPVPTYSLLRVLARLHEATSVELPLAADAALPHGLDREPGQLRFVVNPNAPTGVWIGPELLEDLLVGAEGVVVIDEAYSDFAPGSCLPLLDRHPNWLVVRTFSKSHALAGLRVGYAIGSAELIADLYAVKDSYPVDRCAIAGAMAALEDTEHHRLIVETVRTERERLKAALSERGWQVMPSESNFVFARPPTDTATLVERLRGRRVLVRHFGEDPYRDWVRITVGTAEDHRRLLEAL